MGEKVKYRVNSELYIQHITSDELGLFNTITNEKIIGFNEDSARSLVNIISSFLPCEHKWIDVPDFENSSLVDGMQFPRVKTICGTCHINKI
jgi:hypothetical protein